jgi:hypothetical protein
MRSSRCAVVSAASVERLLLSAVAQRCCSPFSHPTILRSHSAPRPVQGCTADEPCAPAESFFARGRLVVVLDPRVVARTLPQPLFLPHPPPTARRAAGGDMTAMLRHVAAMVIARLFIIVLLSLPVLGLCGWSCAVC